MDRTFADDVLARAVAVLGDVRAVDEDREDAARVIQAILAQACPTEVDLADLLTALSQSLPSTSPFDESSARSANTSRRTTRSRPWIVSKR